MVDHWPQFTEDNMELSPKAEALMSDLAQAEAGYYHACEYLGDSETEESAKARDIASEALANYILDLENGL